MSIELEFISVTLPTSNLIITSLAVVEILGKLLNSTGFLWMKLLSRGIDPRGLGTSRPPPQKKNGVRSILHNYCCLRSSINDFFVLSYKRELHTLVL